MDPDTSFSNLTMSEKRKRLVAMVDTRRATKKKRYEIPSMLEIGEKNIKKPKVKKPINGSTKTKKFNSRAYKKLFKNQGAQMKKVSDHIAAGSDASIDSHEIEEYWVPVHLSHMQIQQYCALLNKNSESLSSSLKDESSLGDILTQTQKCCDHPFLVDSKLRESLKADSGDDQLNAEINVSGKLQLLDKLLLKIKNCGLRVLVLFQSPIIGRDISTGDMLDDLVETRFGHDSYIRIHGKFRSNNDRENRKKDIKMFNNVETGKFVCLLEYRNCHPTMRLSSIDVVILYNSDWNPLNDIKALRKLTLDSKPLGVLRLYSSFTIEEKALILSKQGSIYEHNTTRISYNNCHRLLAWGASYLFSQLSNHPSKSKAKSKSDSCFTDNLVHELSSMLFNKNRKNEGSKSSIISNAQIHKGVYSGNILLLGENEEHTKESCSLLMENGPFLFWKNLLKESALENSCSRLSRRAKKSFRNPGYWREGHEAENVIDTSPPSVPTKSRPTISRRRRRLCTEFEQSTSYDAQCTNIQSQPQQPQTTTVVPPVSDHASPLEPVSDHTSPLETVSDHASPLETVSDHTSPLETVSDHTSPLETVSDHTSPLETVSDHTSPLETVSDHASPLETELENINKERERISKLHEEKKSMLHSECEKEISKIRKKYDALIEEAEICLTKQMNVLEEYCGLVYANKVLADTFTQSCKEEEKTEKESDVLRDVEIPASELVQSRNRCTTTTSIPTLLIPQTQTELNNVNNQENIEKLHSSYSWPELLGEFDSFDDIGYPNLPFLE